MEDNEDKLVLNSVSARRLKVYFTSRINQMVDELVAKKYPQKKKLQTRRLDNRIPIDLIKKDFVKRFKLENYNNGVLSVLINSLVENTYFSKDGKLNECGKKELVFTETEKEILSIIDIESPLYIDIGDVKTLASRLKTSASSFTYNGTTYTIEADKIEDLINQLTKNNDITLDEKSSIKDNVYIIPDELIDILKNRLFRSPQVKDNTISRIRLYDYFTRVSKNEHNNIYVIIKDIKIAEILGIETINLGAFTYTKHSILVNAISTNVDRYTKKFTEKFYEKFAEFVKDNDKINVSKVIECLIVPNIVIGTHTEL
ncbi:DNA binding protein [Cotia virus SPAn232]|uniref:DNA binding protein n=2 Tax=Cotia virus TaxID=39444 RepID=H6TA35_9POXV|nr:DNA binding protein [Cotia virus SPAn232]ADT91075.1 DNA binding protein [Cotia virus SPAn232]AIT70674.1 DNA binding protein [Cotia virus]